MVKRIHLACSDEDHQAYKKIKDKLAVDLGVKNISWESFFLHICGVKKVK